MNPFFRQQLFGVLIRYLALVGAVATGLVAPTLLGSNNHGMGLLYTVVPVVIQGLCEPIWFSLAIRWSRCPTAAIRVQRLIRDGGRLILCGALLTVLYTTVADRSPWTSERLEHLGLAIGCLLMAAAATTCWAVCYYTRRYRTLLYSYGANNLGQIPLMILFTPLAERAFVMTLFCTYALAMLAALCDGHVRAALWQMWITPCRILGRRPHYFSLLSARLSSILVYNGSLVAAGLLIAPGDLAIFRLNLGIMTLARCVIPVAPQMLEVALQGSEPRQVAVAVRRLLVWSVGTALLVMLVALGTLPTLRAFLLNVPWAYHTPDWLVLGLPGFTLIQPISSLLVGLKAERFLRRALLTTCLGMIAGLLTGNPAWCFVGGTLGFYLGFDRRLRRQLDPVINHPHDSSIELSVEPIGRVVTIGGAHSGENTDRPEALVPNQSEIRRAA